MNSYSDTLMFMIDSGALHVQVAAFGVTAIAAVFVFRWGQRRMGHRPSHNSGLRITTVLLGLIVLFTIGPAIELITDGLTPGTRPLKAAFQKATRDPHHAGEYIAALKDARGPDTDAVIAQGRLNIAMQRARQALETQQGDSSEAGEGAGDRLHDLFADIENQPRRPGVSANTRCRVATLLVGAERARQSQVCDNAP